MPFSSVVLARQSTHRRQEDDLEREKKRGHVLPPNLHPSEAPERARYRVKTKLKRRAPKGRDLADLGTCNESFSGFQTVTSLQSRTKRLRSRVVPFREQFANYVRATLPRRAPIIANVTTPMASSLCGDFASDRSDTKSDSEEPAPGGAEKSPQPAPGATGNTSTTAKRRVCSLGRGRTR